MSDADGFAAFKRHTAALGLAFDDEDIVELLRGWEGLQPQLARLRRGLEEPSAGSESGDATA